MSVMKSPIRGLAAACLLVAATWPLAVRADEHADVVNPASGNRKEDQVART